MRLLKYFKLSLLGIMCFTCPFIAIAGNNGFAVVELFTSEGCSSCPPAETTIDRIQNDFPQNVFILEFHVDYWNYLGWKDIYSDVAYSQRQQQYAHFLKVQDIYTPQAVINGKNEMNGSAYSQLKGGIERELTTSTSRKVNISAFEMGTSVQVNYGASYEAGQVLNIALVQREAIVSVKAGENKGRLLKHHNVVRVLQTIESIKVAGTVKLNVPPGVKLGDCYIISYTQKKDGGAITGAASCNIKS